MGLLALMSVVVTSATVVIYGKAIWDPVDLSGRFTGGVGVGVALFILTLDTMCVNLAANLVGPAYDFASLAQAHQLYTTGGLITAGIALLAMPGRSWRHQRLHLHLADRLLGPARSVAGIMLVDYYSCAVPGSTSHSSSPSAANTPTATAGIPPP